MIELADDGLKLGTISGKKGKQAIHCSSSGVNLLLTI
jgi:hypothetical protein